MRRRVWGLCQGVSTAVLYGSLALFISILHNVFLLYYVETFVSVYKIDKMSFWLGETVFLIWNSLNDPLFGWLSDRSFLSSPHCGHSLRPVTLGEYLKQLSRHKNFMWFVSMNLVQHGHALCRGGPHVPALPCAFRLQVFCLICDMKFKTL
uniref:Major facilitator superfamily domain containing 13A n=1 Tax=Sinocyclocheilus rhinocerous TaxID=307959 RepID=A0A673I656_9TELE